MPDNYWIGMEDSSGHNHGEDFRTYVTVKEGDNQEEILRNAVLYIVSMLNSWHPPLEDGWRIAIRKVA